MRLPVGIIAARIQATAGSQPQRKDRLPMIRHLNGANLDSRRWAEIGVVLVALLASSGSAMARARPSFDCAKAASAAEKAICADPALAQADADVAKTYAAVLKTLDPHAGKALRDDQSDFIAYRDQIAGFNENTPKDRQNFDLGEFLRDRVPSSPVSASPRIPVSSAHGAAFAARSRSRRLALASSTCRKRSPILSPAVVRAKSAARSRPARTCGLSIPTTTTGRPALFSSSAAMAMRSSSSRAAPARTAFRNRRHAAPTVMPMAISS